MTRGGSPLWTIETAEKQGVAEEPRSLWDRVESHLRRQEVFTIRRVIGESVLDRNEGLWREVDALEDILKEAQEQNQQLSKKLAARPVMAPGLERTLLEAHLRLLLGKLGVTSGTGSGKGGIAAAIPGSGGVSGGERPRPHTCREHDLGSGDPGSTRSCCAPAERCPKDRSPRRKHGRWSPAKTRGRSSGNSAPNTPCVPLETRQDRAVYEFISASGDGDRSEATGIAETAAMAAGGSVRDSGSRPETGRRPGSSRSARSAPECLESGKCLSVATIDTALGELRAAFEEEAQNLLEEVADLTNLLEDEAARKADGERRSRRNSPSACNDDARGHGKSEGGGGGGGPIPSSELRRFGKKLEEAVRSREHAAEVAQRLATDKKLPRKRISGNSGPVRTTGPPAIGRKEDVRSRGREAPTPRGGGTGVDGGGLHRSSRSRPSMTSASGSLPGRAGTDLQSPSRRDQIGATITLAARANRERDPVEQDLGSIAATAEAGTAMGQPARQRVGRGRDRGVLASKLRGAVRLSREEEALDDERFWN